MSKEASIAGQQWFTVRLDGDGSIGHVTVPVADAIPVEAAEVVALLNDEVAAQLGGHDEVVAALRDHTLELPPPLR